MRTIEFYRLANDTSPIEEFLHSLNSKQAQKVVWVLRLIEELEIVPRNSARAILVTNFWYIRPVNDRNLVLTGMTRDGTFLVEKGEVVSAVKNFRFHESPLTAFQQLEAWTRPMEAVNSETGKMLVPAMALLRLAFSSVTRF